MENIAPTNFNSACLSKNKKDCLCSATQPPDQALEVVDCPDNSFCLVDGSAPLCLRKLPFLNTCLEKSGCWCFGNQREQQVVCALGEKCIEVGQDPLCTKNQISSTETCDKTDGCYAGVALVDNTVYFVPVNFNQRLQPVTPDPPKAMPNLQTGTRCASKEGCRYINGDTEIVCQENEIGAIFDFQESKGLSRCFTHYSWLNEFCKDEFCIYDLPEKQNPRNLICSKDKLAFSHNGVFGCFSELLKLEETCHEQFCLCPTSKMSKMSMINASKMLFTLVIVSENEACSRSNIRENEGCKTSSCLCLAPPNPKTVLNVAKCSRGDTCRSKNGLATCFTSFVKHQEICKGNKCHCSSEGLIGDVNHQICEQDQSCQVFGNQEAFCTHQIVETNEVCQSDLCHSLRRNKKGDIIDVIILKRKEYLYMIKEEIGGRYNEMIRSDSLPIGEVCKNNLCVCLPNQKSHPYVLIYINEICTSDVKRIRDPAYILAGQQCFENKCQCIDKNVRRGGAITRDVKKNQFCMSISVGHYHELFGLGSQISPYEKCTDEAGCECIFNHETLGTLTKRYKFNYHCYWNQKKSYLEDVTVIPQLTKCETDTCICMENNQLNFDSSMEFASFRQYDVCYFHKETKQLKIARRMFYGRGYCPEKECLCLHTEEEIKNDPSKAGVFVVIKENDICLSKDGSLLPPSMLLLTARVQECKLERCGCFSRDSSNPDVIFCTKGQFCAEDHQLKVPECVDKKVWEGGAICDIPKCVFCRSQAWYENFSVICKQGEIGLRNVNNNYLSCHEAKNPPNDALVTGNPVLCLAKDENQKPIHDLCYKGQTCKRFDSSNYFCEDSSKRLRIGENDICLNQKVGCRCNKASYDQPFTADCQYLEICRFDHSLNVLTCAPKSEKKGYECMPKEWCPCKEDRPGQIKGISGICDFDSNKPMTEVDKTAENEEYYLFENIRDRKSSVAWRYEDEPEIGMRDIYMDEFKI